MFILGNFWPSYSRKSKSVWEDFSWHLLRMYKMHTQKPDLNLAGICYVCSNWHKQMPQTCTTHSILTHAHTQKPQTLAGIWINIAMYNTQYIDTHKSHRRICYVQHAVYWHTQKLTFAHGTPGQGSWWRKLWSKSFHAGSVQHCCQ